MLLSTCNQKYYQMHSVGTASGTNSAHKKSYKLVLEAEGGTDWHSRVVSVDELARAEVHIQWAFTGTLALCLLHALAVQAKPVVLRQTSTNHSVK